MNSPNPDSVSNADSSAASEYVASQNTGQASVEKTVRNARQRLILGHFGRGLSVTLFVAMLVSTIAIAVLAIVPLQIDGQLVNLKTWITSWVAGTGALALIGAAVFAWWKAPSKLSVAAEVDKRFGLRERLSSSLAIEPERAEAPAALALQSDAEQRADGLAVAEKFPLQPGRITWFPLAIAPVLVAMILTVKPAGLIDPDLDNTINANEVRQVKSAAAELKKRLAQQRRDAEAKGLEEARELFENMEKKLDKITASKTLTRKDALIQLNDLKEQIQQRKDRIGSPDQLKKTLSQMKGLEGGAAEKVANQIQRGEFGKAAEEIKKIAKQIKEGKLGEKEKQKLAEQAKELVKQLKQAAQQHEQQKQELKEKIEQAKREGRSEDAAKMQQQLNQAEAADSQMQKMQQMAQAMEDAANAMQQGESQAAADALEEMAEQLGDMQQAMSELEELQNAMDELSQSKNQMNCKQCNGAGCQACQGFGDGEKPGEGLGRGRGKGDRPESEDDINTYDTQVRGDVKRGKAVIAGFADGPNRKGVTREQIKNVIDSAIGEESDPLEDQVLPRDEREQTREYFNQLREGT